MTAGTVRAGGASTGGRSPEVGDAVGVPAADGDGAGGLEPFGRVAPGATCRGRGRAVGEGVRAGEALGAGVVAGVGDGAGLQQ
jgi:hypothetical protein